MNFSLLFSQLFLHFSRKTRAKLLTFRPSDGMITCEWSTHADENRLKPVEFAGFLAFSRFFLHEIVCLSRNSGLW